MIDFLKHTDRELWEKAIVKAQKNNHHSVISATGKIEVRESKSAINFCPVVKDFCDKYK